jgi:hypothetical protein
MRSSFMLGAMLLVASVAFAQDPKPYQAGRLSLADPACVSQEKSCQQYVLEADGVVFHIRPKHLKHALSLPEGDRAEFRIQNGNILLRIEGFEDTEREYVVMSIAPRSENNAADARPVRLNHLQ